MDDFNVSCLNCGQVWSPQNGSPLWWAAKQYAAKGYLDALHVSGEKCGCIKMPAQPDAPFRVFGYDFDLKDFEFTPVTFTEAVRLFRELNDGLCDVSIEGVSAQVEQRLRFPVY